MKVENINKSVRQYSGICLPAEDGKGVTLRAHCNDNPNLAQLTGSLSISGTLEVKGESTLTGNVNANGSLTVTNNGVYIRRIEGQKNALKIDENKTDYPTLDVRNNGEGVTLYVEQNGSGNLATFKQSGVGDGVCIGGIKGKNNALKIDENETEYPTLDVRNKGQGETLYVEQTGKGIAAKFHGQVTIENGWLNAPRININWYNSETDGILTLSAKNGKYWYIKAENSGAGGSGHLTIYPDGNTEIGQWLSRDNGGWHKNSDFVLKDEVVKLQGILEKALELNPVSFVWKNNKVADIGFIAQEVEQIFPEIVSTTYATGRELKGISYSQFNVIAIAAIKEMKIQFDREISELKQKMKEIQT